MYAITIYQIISIITFIISHFTKHYLIKKYPKHKFTIQIIFAILDIIHISHLIYLLFL